MSKATVRDVECIGETEKAILIDFGSGFEEWVPKSAVHDDSEVWKKDQQGDLVIWGWMAVKLGLEKD